MNNRKVVCINLLFVLTCLLVGCGDITGRGPAKLDNTVDPVLRQQHNRVGYVYCMRGWLGIFSTGMDALADQIDSQVSAPAVSVADEEWFRLKEWLTQEHNDGKLNEGPLVLLGHSYGADDMIRVSEHLKTQGISVDLLVLIDPVTPPPVPDNVKRVYCLYFSHPATDWYPAWRGVPARVADPKTPISNTDLRLTDVGFDTTIINHINIEKVDGVHAMVMKEIEKLCPPRTAWLQTHPGNPVSASVAAHTPAVPAMAPPPAPANGVSPAITAQPVIKPNIATP